MFFNQSLGEDQNRVQLGSLICYATIESNWDEMLNSWYTRDKDILRLTTVVASGFELVTRIEFSPAARLDRE